MLHEIQRERESELLAVLKVSLKVFIRNDIDNTESHAMDAVDESGSVGDLG